MRVVRVAVCAGLLLAGATRAHAQVWVGNAAPHFGSLEVSGGAIWSAGFDLGTRAAEETRNPGTATGPFSLFQSSSEVASAPGVVVRLGFYLSRLAAIEAGVHYLRPVVSTRVTADAEEAPSATVQETLTRLVIDGSLVFHLQSLAFAHGRAVPFVSGGAGYLRELHEANEFIETGTEYHVGGGVKFWLGADRHRFGVRGDLGVSIRDGGFDFSDDRRALPTAGIGVMYRF